LKGSKTSQSSSDRATPGEDHPRAMKCFMAGRLRLVMEQREEVVSRLVDLDYQIWVLEEFFRGGSA
jgi:hypothetical protein